MIITLGNSKDGHAYGVPSMVAPPWRTSIFLCIAIRSVPFVQARKMYDKREHGELSLNKRNVPFLLRLYVKDKDKQM